MHFLGGGPCERELAKGSKFILCSPCSVCKLAELGLFCLALLHVCIINMALNALKDFALVRTRCFESVFGVPRVRCQPRALP